MRWAGRLNKEFVYLVDGPESAKWKVVLAHGAGAPMDTPFMNEIAEGLSSNGIMVVRFEFPYMRERRLSGKRRGPGPAKSHTGYFLKVIEDIGDRHRLVIGGKSMGGRVASMVADEAHVAGLVCLGYPFHPPGRPEHTRTEHLEALNSTALFLQGSRDAFGSREDIVNYTLSSAISIVFLEDGDHSFRPRKATGSTLAEHLNTSVAEIARFIDRLN